MHAAESLSRAALERLRHDLARLESARPDEVRVELDGPASVRSGSTLRHTLVLTDVGRAAVDVHTNGHLTAGVAPPVFDVGRRVVTPPLDLTITA